MSVRHSCGYGWHGRETRPQLSIEINDSDADAWESLGIRPFYPRRFESISPREIQGVGRRNHGRTGLPKIDLPRLDQAIGLGSEGSGDEAVVVDRLHAVGGGDAR
ncbi:MAG: hypothetical protein GWP61_17605 [Chloroflexi bacterium]|nr:hypothetical protein [Chloroflexota bacterium]